MTAMIARLLALTLIAAAPSLAATAMPDRDAAPAATETRAAPFALAPLPYAVDALEPVIDRKTMTLHHGRHHRAYVDKLNAEAAKDARLAALDVTALQRQISRFPTAVRDNGGGHWNHSLFWRLMAPQGQGGAPSAELAAAIERDFGSMAAFKKAFDDAGIRRFGSGWAWLIRKPDGRLRVTSTANQDNPLMDAVPEAERGIPLLGNDVWEHAYYLQYQNQRAAYLAAWWNVVNWHEVNRRFVAAEIGEAGLDMPPQASRP